MTIHLKKKKTKNIENEDILVITTTYTTVCFQAPNLSSHLSHIERETLSRREEASERERERERKAERRKKKTQTHKKKKESKAWQRNLVRESISRFS